MLVSLNKLDVLEHWIVHLFNDESEKHLMKESREVQSLTKVGFKQISLSHRQELNALLMAEK